MRLSRNMGHSLMSSASSDVGSAQCSSKPRAEPRGDPFCGRGSIQPFRRSARRTVVPLVSAREFGDVDSDVGPQFLIGDTKVVLAPLQITNVPADALGPRVMSLAGEESRIVNALDAVFSRAWR